jgi:3'(2'), 5'-bisphosphate nucleotidase
MDYNYEKQVAVKAVTEAAQLCVAVQSEMIKADALVKGDRSPVTIADFGSQALVCRRLSSVFPQDPIVAEEDATELKKPANKPMLMRVTRHVQKLQADATLEQVCAWIDRGNDTVSERYWTLDPIDGTKGFLRDGQYAVALALVENGQVKVGALACPALPLYLSHPRNQIGVLFWAVKGAGTTMASLIADSSISIHVAHESSKGQLRFVESVEAAHGNQPLQQAIAHAVGISHPSLRMDSQAKYGAVARGDAVLYLRLPSEKSPEYRENIWDHAAGTLIVEEAGGQVTDMYGRSLDFASGHKMQQNQGVVVSNGKLHAPVLDALKQFREQ